MDMWTKECRSNYFKEYYKKRKLADITFGRQSSEYWQEYNKKRPGKSTSGMHKLRFGGLRKLILERDNYTCVDCGMSNEEHKEKWNREITINHIDGEGRYSLIPNNKPSNLETLCLKCHGRKDSLKYWHGEERGQTNH